MQNKLKILASEDCIDFNKESLEIFKNYNINLSFLPKDGFKVIETFIPMKYLENYYRNYCSGNISRGFGTYLQQACKSYRRSDLP